MNNILNFAWFIATLSIPLNATASVTKAVSTPLQPLIEKAKLKDKRATLALLAKLGHIDSKHMNSSRYLFWYNIAKQRQWNVPDLIDWRQFHQYRVNQQLSNSCSMRIELSVDCALYFAERAVNDDNLASAATFLKGLQQLDIHANDLWRRLTLKQHGPRLFDVPLFPLSVDALDSLLRDHSLSQSHVAHSDTVTKWAFTNNDYATSLTIDVNGSGAIKTMSFHLVDNNVTKRAIEFLTASIDTPIMNKPRYYWHTAGLDIHINTKYNTITYTRERN